MTRPPSSDEPTREARSRMMRTRWRRTSGLYLSSDGAHTVASYVDPAVTIDLGSREVVSREPEKSLWAIERGGAPEPAYWLVFNTFAYDYSEYGYAQTKITGGYIGPPIYLGDMATLGPAADYLAVSPDGQYMACELQNTGDTIATVGLFSWDGEKFVLLDTLTGFGSTSDALSFDFNPVSNDLVIGFNGTSTGEMPFEVYAISPAGFGAQYPDPAVFGTDYIWDSCKWHPSGNAIAINEAATAEGWGLSVYHWIQGVGFGTKYAPPASKHAANAISVGWHPPSGDYIFTETHGPGTVSGFDVYEFDLAAGFGARSAQPSVFEEADGAGCAFGEHAIYVPRRSQGLIIYPFAAGVVGDGVEYDFTEAGYASPQWTTQMMLSKDAKMLAGAIDDGGLRFIWTIGEGVSLIFNGVIYSPSYWMPMDWRG